MNYIEIINLYWKLREQGILDAGCGDLYLYLVHKSNSLGWKNPFNQSNSLVRAFINVSEPTLIRQRNVLKQLGLIEFESGKALRSNTTYYLNNLSSVVSRHFSSDVSSVFSRVDEKPLDYIKQETKPNETKHEESADKPHSKNHSKKSNPEKGKEKSSEQKESSVYTACMKIYHDWFLERYKIGPKIDALQGKSMKEIVAYISSNAKRKDDEVLTESDLNEKIQGGWKWILDNWDKLDDFRKQNTKLNQISSDIQNIIVKIKNQGYDGNGNQKGNNFGGAVADAEQVLKIYFGNTQD